MDKRTCSVDGCMTQARKRQWCNTHYCAGLKDGSIKRLAKPADADRFWSRVDRGDNSECWNWTAALTADGYGAFRAEGRSSRAHRYSYASEHGPVPAGALVDHICHNKACVNPSHLRLATNKQNQENRRGPQANSTSGERGVSWSAARGKWEATVTHNHKAYRAGRFDTAHEAGEAARKLRAELFTHSQN